MAAPIDFYFDFASPYGYLASRCIDDIAARHGREVTWRPILLGAIFKVTGMKPNMQQPLRGEYLRHDVVRFARLLGVPFTFPEVMPINSLAAARACWWLNGTDPAAAKRLAQAIYHAHFGEGRNVEPPEAVLDVAESLGLDRAAAAAGMQDPAVKERVKREVDEAITRGVYGSPFFIVDGEPFWGADRLDQVEKWLATGGW